MGLATLFDGRMRSRTQVVKQVSRGMRGLGAEEVEGVPLNGVKLIFVSLKDAPDCV